MTPTARSLALLRKSGYIPPNSELAISGFSLGKLGLTANGKPSFEDWQRAGQSICLLERAIHFLIGDWLVYGEQHYGKMYQEALEVTQFEYGTLANDKYVASSVELSRRHENLSWAHHYEVAGLSPKKQDRLLDRAENEGWSRARLREEVAKIRGLEASRKAGNFPDGKFSVILADPPWQYNDQRLGTVAGGGAVGQYPTMDLESICKMDVASLAAEDAVLFLWATAPCFPDALQAAYSWGFSYKTNLVWNKVRGFNGHYSDVQHEHLLIATRGSCLPSGPLHKSIFTEEKQRHSKKPELVYTIIESMYPAVPRVELFSRSKREGWKTWGDDAPSDGVKPVMGQLSSRGDGVASARRSGLTA